MTEREVLRRNHLREARHLEPSSTQARSITSTLATKPSMDATKSIATRPNR
jgi:hypothetical protein